MFCTYSTRWIAHGPLVVGSKRRLLGSTVDSWESGEESSEVTLDISGDKNKIIFQKKNIEIGKNIFLKIDLFMKGKDLKVYVFEDNGELVTLVQITLSLSLSIYLSIYLFVCPLRQYVHLSQFVTGDVSRLCKFSSFNVHYRCSNKEETRPPGHPQHRHIMLPQFLIPKSRSIARHHPTNQFLYTITTHRPSSASK